MNKEVKYLYGGIIFGILAIIGVTYAFFSTSIVGDRKNVSVDMSDLKIIFTNGDAIEATDISAEDNFDVVKTFSVENKTKNVYSYNIVIESLLNTFKTSGYLVYKITSNDGGYNMTEFKDVPKSTFYRDVELANNINITANGKHNYNIEIKYINSETENQSIDSNAILSGKLYIEHYENRNKNLASVMLEDNPTIEERTDFTSSDIAYTTGKIYQTNKTENGNLVYYYYGNTENNWIKFGKWNDSFSIYKGYYSADSTYAGAFYYIYNSKEECANSDSYNYLCAEEKIANKGDDMYWRIIRTNEDGSIRLLYSGTNSETSEGYVAVSSFNILANDPMYAGYMYGTSGSLENNRTNTNDSIIKKKVDKWYENNLLTGYDKYISKSAIYCNDRSTQNNSYTTSQAFSFGASVRANVYDDDKITPSYKCGDDGFGGLFETTQAIADKFSASTEGGGNGQLKYPIALMTFDEVIFAGSVDYQRDLKSWYFINKENKSITNDYRWWTITPSSGPSRTSNYELSMENDQNTGFTGTSDVDNNINRVIRPVISLSACIRIKAGDGTADFPYIIDYDNSCN